MTKFKVLVELVVEADSEVDAFFVSEAAVENLVAGDIFSASVDCIVELE